MNFRQLTTSVVLAAATGIAWPALSQHQHHMPSAADTMQNQAPGKHAMKSMQPDSTSPHGGMHHMTHSFSLSLPMSRNGSGTGWQPDATPMYAYMKHSSKWNCMLHGSVFFRYTAQNFTNTDRRGSASRLSAPNWFMGMAQRQVGKNGLFNVRGMISLDRLTDGGAGYPLLFQSGESWEGQPLVDRQHPHDLISELSVAYTQRFTDKIDVTLYAGYPGEPALGPTAFMHRMSAFNNPDAVLGHHWQDATHITFGVVTAGIRYGMFKLEGSSFTGREPDENRFNFDKPRFDSYSYRLLFNPSTNWAIQASQGYIKSPERLHGSENVNRTTASVQHTAGLGAPGRWISSSAVWGMNRSGDHHEEHAVLLETNLQLDKWAIYGRYEWVQKSLEELAIPVFDEGAQELYPISQVTLGINRQIASFKNTLLQAGAQVGLYTIDPELHALYGRHLVSAQVYLRLTPGLMQM